MYDRLKILYQLQTIDNQLDELEELRGDLPNMVRQLEEKINGMIPVLFSGMKFIRGLGRINSSNGPEN